MTTKNNQNTTRLQELIALAGISKKKIADHCGVHPYTVSTWISGKHRTPPMVLEWLEQVVKAVNGNK